MLHCLINQAHILTVLLLILQTYSTLFWYFKGSLVRIRVNELEQITAEELFIRHFDPKIKDLHQLYKT